jgi:hypothetical protein
MTFLARFLRRLFILLIRKEKSLGSIAYTVQGLRYTLSDFQFYKPNLGTAKYLLKNQAIDKAIQTHIAIPRMHFFCIKEIPHIIATIQPHRNEAAHGEGIGREDAQSVRNAIVGIGESGYLCDLIDGRVALERFGAKG